MINLIHFHDLVTNIDWKNCSFVIYYLGLWRVQTLRSYAWYSSVSISSNLVFLTVCAVLLTVVMGIRYAKTRKIMPAGIIAAIRFAQSSLLHKGTSLLCQVLIYICIQSPNVTWFGPTRYASKLISFDYVVHNSFFFCSVEAKLMCPTA